MPEPELQYEFAIPNDPDIDRFESGDDEVDKYFHSRGWFDDKSGKTAPPTYKFTDGNRVIGFASVAFRNCSHPNEKSATKARYLVVYAVGVDRTFHGTKIRPGSNETYAMTLFRTLCRFGSERPGTVGLSLWVRANNARAIAFYKKAGLQQDPDGPIQRDAGAPHITMRKLYNKGGS